MVESGDVAKLGPYATTVYLVIKTYANYSTGTAFPGIDLIGEKSGISKSQVIRALSALEESGYIGKKQVGRKNVYTLRERIEVKGPDGRPEAVATWDYVPQLVTDAQAELKNFLLTGGTADAKIIQIQHLHLNVINGDNNLQLNIGALTSNIDDPELKASVESCLRSITKNQKKTP
jgi:hypothetical protein